VRNIFEKAFTSIEQVRKEWENCTECVFSSLWKETGPCLPLNSNTKKDVLVVGQWPGAQDMKNRVPFSGKQGKIAISMIEIAGFQKEQLFLTNVLLCACPIVPTKATLTFCRKQIDQTIDVIRPTIIITLGKYAAVRMGIRNSMHQVHGTSQKYRGIVVVPCIHPAAISRAKTRTRKKETFEKVSMDLQKAWNFYQKEGRNR